MAGHWAPRQRSNRAPIIGLVLFVIFVFYYRDILLGSNTPARKHRNDYPTLNLDDNAVEMVVASMKHENVSWLDEYLPEWKKNIYVVDDNKAKLTVPMNKGREAMVFLTYIPSKIDSISFANALQLHH